MIELKNSINNLREGTDKKFEKMAKVFDQGRTQKIILYGALSEKDI